MKTIFGFVIFTKKDMANMNEYIDSILEDNKKIKSELSELGKFNKECVTNIQTLKSELSALKNRPRNAKCQYVKSEVQNEN